MVSVLPIPQNIGEEDKKVAMTLKALRVNSGLKQKEAAERIGVTPETLGSWENAKSFPNVKQINRIEKLYHTCYADIIFLPKYIGLTEAAEET